MRAKKMRPDVYAALLAALETNGGYVWRGRDKQPGAQAGLGTLLMLERRGWVRLVRAMIRKSDGRDHREVFGGWVTRAGRSALRDEVIDRGAPMPARLARPGQPAGVVAGPRSVTRYVDPFALVASGRPAEPVLAF